MWTMNNGASGIRVGVPVCPQLRDGIANSEGLKLGSVNFASRIANTRTLDFARKTAVEGLQRHACTLQCGRWPKFANARVRAGKGGRGMLGSWYAPKRRKIAEGKILGGGGRPYKHLVHCSCLDLDPGMVQCCIWVSRLEVHTM